MAINYSIARMKNPAEPDVYKYYPKAQIRSDGADTEDTYSTSMIRKVTLQFRPGVGLKGQLNKANLTFHKVKSLKQQETEEEPLP